MPQDPAKRKRPVGPIRLPVAVWAALDALADRWGVSRSVVVERLIGAALTPRESREGG